MCGRMAGTNPEMTDTQNLPILLAIADYVFAPPRKSHTKILPLPQFACTEINALPICTAPTHE